MGLRGKLYSDKSKEYADSFRDNMLKFGEESRAQDERKRLEERRSTVEGARKEAFDTMQETLTPEFLASEDLDRKALAQAFLPAYQQQMQYGDPTLMKGAQPYMDFLLGDVEAAEQLEKARVGAGGRAKSLDARLTKDKRKEFKEKVSEVRKFNKERKNREVGGLGIARTADDAKKVKAAAVIKEDLDGMLKRMKKIRTDMNGLEYVFPSKAAAEGKSLAKQVLLAVKDLANLGVLSKSDEKILKQIVPEDPTGIGFIETQLDTLVDTVENRYQVGLDKRLEQRYAPGEQFSGVDEPVWEGEGPSPVVDLTIDKKLSAKAQEDFSKKVKEAANDEKKFNKLFTPQEVKSWKENNPIITEAGRKVLARKLKKEPTPEDMARFIRQRMVREKMSK